MHLNINKLLTSWLKSTRISPVFSLNSLGSGITPVVLNHECCLGDISVLLSGVWADKLAITFCQHWNCYQGMMRFIQSQSASHWLLGWKLCFRCLILNPIGCVTSLENIGAKRFRLFQFTLLIKTQNWRRNKWKREREQGLKYLLPPPSILCYNFAFRLYQHISEQMSLFLFHYVICHIYRLWMVFNSTQHQK